MSEGQHPRPPCPHPSPAPPLPGPYPPSAGRLQHAHHRRHRRCCMGPEGLGAVLCCGAQAIHAALPDRRVSVSTASQQQRQHLHPRMCGRWINTAAGGPVDLVCAGPLRTCPPAHLRTCPRHTPPSDHAHTHARTHTSERPPTPALCPALPRPALRPNTMLSPPHFAPLSPQLTAPPPHHLALHWLGGPPSHAGLTCPAYLAAPAGEYSSRSSMMQMATRRSSENCKHGTGDDVNTWGVRF